jgi:hypothetical protein
MKRLLKQALLDPEIVSIVLWSCCLCRLAPFGRGKHGMNRLGRPPAPHFSQSSGASLDAKQSSVLDRL